jgi:hypothetical protein
LKTTDLHHKKERNFLRKLLLLFVDVSINIIETLLLSEEEEAKKKKKSRRRVLFSLLFNNKNNNRRIKC